MQRPPASKGRFHVSKQAEAEKKEEEKKKKKDRKS